MGDFNLNNFKFNPFFTTFLLKYTGFALINFENNEKFS